MAVTNNIDLVLTYDSNQLIAIGKALSPDAPDANEYAVQCVVIEILRDILATGITLDEWNKMEEPEPWNTWWAERQSRGFERAKLNVAATQTPLLTSSELAQAAAITNTIFEIGYDAYMANVSNVNRVTFTKLGGV